MAAADDQRSDDVSLTDLEVIQRFSLAVRGATASREAVITALEADLAWLGGRPRAAAPKPAVRSTVAKPPAARPKPAAKATRSRQG